MYEQMYLRDFEHAFEHASTIFDTFLNDTNDIVPTGGSGPAFIVDTHQMHVACVACISLATKLDNKWHHLLMRDVGGKLPGSKEMLQKIAFNYVRVPNGANMYISRDLSDGVRMTVRDLIDIARFVPEICEYTDKRKLCEELTKMTSHAFEQTEYTEDENKFLSKMTSIDKGTLPVELNETLDELLETLGIRTSSI